MATVPLITSSYWISIFWQMPNYLYCPWPYELQTKFP